MLHTYVHTDKQTYRPSDEAGSRGAFAPNKRVLNEESVKYTLFKFIECGKYNLKRGRKMRMFYLEKNFENIIFLIVLYFFLYSFKIGH